MSFPQLFSIPFFKDHGKNASDLLGKGFPSTDKYIWKFEAATVSNNGTQFLPNVSYDGNVTGEFKVKGKIGDTVTSLSTKTDNSITVESLYSRNLGGFKPTLTITSGFSNIYKFKAKLSGEARWDRANATVFVEAPNPLFKEDQDNRVGASFVGGDPTSGVSAGVEFESSIDKKALEKLNGALAYSQTDSQLAFFGKKTYGTKPSLVFGVNYYQRVAESWSNLRDLVVASEYSHTVDGPNNFLFGFQFKPDTFSDVKFRFRHTGSLGFSYTQQWGGPFSLTFLGETGKLIGAENPLTWGVKLSLK